MIKILTVTGSRSEYDLLYPLLKNLNNHKKIILNIQKHLLLNQRL